MRILIASGIFHPESGGPATYLNHLLPDLQAHGHEITALSFGEATTNTYPYPVTRISRQRNVIARRLAYRKAAGRLWPGHDVAYIHTLGLMLPGSIRPRVAKIVGDTAWERAMNKGWVPSDTDIDQFQTQKQSIPAELNKMQRASEAQHLDHIIVPSEYLKNMVAGWGVSPERIIVIYNALHDAVTVPPESQAEARHKLNLAPRPTLFTAARLTPWKGIDHTLHALATLEDVRLVIAGDGPDRSRLEALTQKLGLSQRVTFLGHVDREKMPLYFRAADYFMLYSGYEGLPHVLLEALSVGTPVIASDKGGNPEVIRHGKNGLLVPYIDRDALQDTITEAFGYGVKDRLSTHTQDGLERFSWPDLVKKTMHVLELAASD